MGWDSMVHRFKDSEPEIALRIAIFASEIELIKESKRKVKNRQLEELANKSQLIASKLLKGYDPNKSYPAETIKMAGPIVSPGVNAPFMDDSFCTTNNPSES